MLNKLHASGAQWYVPLAGVSGSKYDKKQIIKLKTILTVLDNIKAISKVVFESLTSLVFDKALVVCDQLGKSLHTIFQ